MSSSSSYPTRSTINYFDVHEEYICPECNHLLKDVVQTNCGHFLCNDCAGVIFYTQKEHARCPLEGCGKKLQGDDGTKYFPDHQRRREINSLLPMCLVEGCNWSGSHKYWEEHLIECHTTVWQSTPKRKASHVLLRNDQQRDNLTPQQLRETAHQMQQSVNNLLEHADSLERIKAVEYVVRASADSLRKNQAGNGAEASSNKTLNRASEFGTPFPETRASTLDATAVHFETTPELENVERCPVTIQPEAQEPRRTQMVPGMTCTLKQQYTVTSSSPQTTNPPPLPPRMSKTSGRHAASATAQVETPRRRQQRRPPPLPPIAPNKSAQPAPTLSPWQPLSPGQHVATQQSKSPTTHLPPLSSKAPIQVTKQSSQATPFLTKAPPPPLITTPTIIPPPRILQTKNLPISHTSILPSPCVETKKPNTLPQVTQGHKCTNTDCKRKIKTLTAVAQELIITCSVCQNCHKNKKFHNRFRSL